MSEGFLIERGPNVLLKIDGKDYTDLINYITTWATDNNADALGTIIALIDTACVQAAGIDHDEGTPGQALNFLASVLGSAYSNAIKNFASGTAVQLESVRKGPHGAH